MRLANQHLIRIAAVLALTAASSSAFAQSAEYRRGYDAGFAAGQRATSDDRGRGNRLRVLEATYGGRGKVCDARREVRDAIERNGALRVDNGLCGDPNPGVQKRLEVVYRCGDDEPQRVGARENETLRLSCRR